jgi:carboxymethylenebutenolidase
VIQNNQSVRWGGFCRLSCWLLGSLAPLSLSAAPDPARSTGAPTYVGKTSFTSGDKKIKVEEFVPGKEGKYPAVVLLCGIDGLHSGNQLLFRTASKQLADKGFVVLLVHYQDRTGTGLEDTPALIKQFRGFLRDPKGTGEQQRAMRKLFAAWEGTVRDAVSYARAHARVEKERVALVGYSLGGFLAASVAASADQRIAAVVTLFGGIPSARASALKRFPPSLILAGDRDEVVPVKESHDLRDLLLARKLTCSAKIYEGVGHGFTRDGKLDFRVALDAQVRIGTFLARHLARQTAEPPAQAPSGGKTPKKGRKRFQEPGHDSRNTDTMSLPRLGE